MNVAVLGHSSFLGSHLIDRMRTEPDNRVVLFGRKRPDSDEKYVFFESPGMSHISEQLLTFDHIFYLVAAGVQRGSKSDDQLTFEVNLYEVIRLSLFLQAHKFRGTLTTFGSYFEIGQSQIKTSYDELYLATHTNLQPNAYCSSKNLLTRFLTINQMSYTHYHLVLPTIYGVGENPNRLMPYILKEIKDQKKLYFSSGTQTRQYLHVRDLVSLICDHLLKGKLNPGIYNVSASNTLTIKELVNEVLKKAGCKNEASFGENEFRDENMPFLALDDTKLKAEVKWVPQIAIKDGIKEYYNLYFQ
ncbi:MAG: NAD(P)-dependent oxidoreductase [Cytophagia bacterium]|nr:NAD(P)-dependent oxidoreductase [Cytophagia bacterium]